MSDKNPVQLKISPSFVFFLTATLLVVILYGNTLKVPFIFDDVPNIVENNTLHWNKPLSFSKITQSLISHRPLSNLTFGLNYYFGKLNVKGYHLVNIFLHLLNTLFLFYFLNLILKLGLPEQEPNRAIYLASIISLLWAGSPVQTQAVNYIVQRMTLLACLFYLLGLIAYVKARSTVSAQKIYWFLLAFVFGVMALFSKENTVFFPLTCLLIDFQFISKFQWNKFKKYFNKAAPYILFTGILIVIYLFIHPEIKDIFLHRSSSQEFTIWERVMTEWRVLVYYLSLLTYPDPNRLSIDYFYPISKNFFQPVTTFTSLMFIVFLIGFAIRKAQVIPLVSFGILWFFINLLVESTFIPIDLVFEHRLYLPSIGFFIVIGVSILQLLSNKNLPSVKIVGIGLFLVTLCFEGIFAAERNQAWQNEVSLWEKVVKNFPDSFRAHINLGKAYDDKGLIDLAEKEYLRTVELHPDDALAHNDYASVLLKKGDIIKAEAEFKKSIALNKNLYVARYNLANLHGRLENPEVGVIETKELLSQFPELIQGYVYLGELYETLNKIEEAKRAYLAGSEINPDSLEPLNHLGVLFLKIGDYKGGEQFFKKALMIDPNSDRLHQNLGRTYQLQGFVKESLEEYIRAYELNPLNSAIHYNIGSLFLQKGNDEAAVSEFEKGAGDKPSKEELPLLNEALSSIHNPNLQSRIKTLISKIPK